jgi:small basic protein
MQINEDTPGSVANQEAVKLLKGWLLALYVVDCLVCLIGASSKNLSLWYTAWFLFESLFFSYFLGFVLLAVTVRYFSRRLGIPEIKQVGFLRFCVVFACLSVIMGGLLVYREPAGPPLPWVHRP